MCQIPITITMTSSFSWRPPCVVIVTTLLILFETKLSTQGIGGISSSFDFFAAITVLYDRRMKVCSSCQSVDNRLQKKRNPRVKYLKPMIRSEFIVSFVEDHLVEDPTLSDGFLSPATYN